jgi:hypothetical protein
MSYLRILRVILFFLLLFPVLLLAQGRVFWQENGVCICNERFGGGYPRSISIIRGGSESAISFYQYEQMGNYWVYAQRIDNQGNCLWAQNGIPVSVRNSVSNDFCAIEDGKGGAIIVWTNDFVGQYADQIYAQRMDSNGTLLWSPNGVIITGSEIPVGYGVACVSDMRGGAIIGWSIGYELGDSAKLFVQRIDSTGNLCWNPNGVLLTESVPQILWHGTMVSDEKRGAIVIWVDRCNRGTQYDIYAQRIDSAGFLLWQPRGAPVCTANGEQVFTSCARSINSTIISWCDSRSDFWDIYAQRLNDAGLNLWQETGVPICSIPGWNGAPTAIIGNTNGGAIIVWNDVRSDSEGIYAQEIDSSGIIGWARNGIFITYSVIPDYGLTATSDNRNGAIICWQDYRHDNWDIYCQRIQEDGRLVWRDTGLAVCTDTLDQKWGPAITSDGQDGAIIVWGDRRPVGWPYGSVYGQRVGDDVGIEKAYDRITLDCELQICPTPTKSLLRVNCPASIKEPIDIKIFNVSGKLIKEIATSASQSRNDRIGEIKVSLKGINPGIYFLEIGKEVKKFLVVK